MAAKVLVIDDDKKITALLRRSLVFEGYDVQVAGNGEEGLRLAASWQPDLVLLDVLMPGMDGWEVCRRLRVAGPELPVLMLTARDEVADRVKGLDLGADDYLVKPFALEELMARVRALLRRKGGEAGVLVLAFKDLTLDHTTREVKRGQRDIQLTFKEFELLSLFMEHPRQVLTRDLIMDRVWGFDYNGESNVLEVYVGMLRQKLEEGGEPRLIQTVRGVGYVFK